MAEWSEILFSRLPADLRIDAEYYRPEALAIRAAIDASPHPVARLEELSSSIINFGAYSLCNYITFRSEGVPFITAENILEGHIDFATARFISADQHANLLWKSKVSQGQVLVAMAARLGYAAVYDSPRPLSSSQDVAKVTLADPSATNPYYIAAFINSRLGRGQLLASRTGSVQQHTDLGKIKDLKVVVAPRPTQEQVANTLVRALSGMERASALYREAESHLLCEMHLDSLDLSHELTYEASFSDTQAAGRLDAEYWRSDYVAVVSHLFAGAHRTLADLADFSNGATPLGANYLDAGVPFLRIQNVQTNRLDLEDVVYIPDQVHSSQLQRSQLRPGDVLITITGRIGTAAVVPDDLPVANMNQHSVRLRLRDPAKMSPYYLAAFLNSPLGRLQTERESYGTTRDALPYYCLKRILVPDAPLPLQRAVEATVRSADGLRRDARSLLDEAKRRVEEAIGQ